MDHPASIQRIKSAGLAGLCVLLCACTDAAAPPDDPPLATLSIHPSFARVEAASGAPVNRIAVSARNAATDRVAGTSTKAVDPSAAQWEISLDVVLSSSAPEELVVVLELIHVEGATQTVEWGGRTTVVVTAGQTHQVTDLRLSPGAAAAVASLAVTPAQATVAVGRIVQLTAIARDAQGNPLDRAITWSSSDNARAPVSSTGLVNGIAAGDATISASAEGKRATSVITVYAAAAANLAKVSGDTQTGTVSTRLPAPLVVRVTDARGNAFPGHTVQWAVTAGGGSADPGSSVTDADGLAATRITLGPGAGAQTVEARAPGLAGAPAVFTATAVSSAVATVSVAPATRTLRSGDTATFVATARNAEGFVLPNVVFAWSSADSTVAEVRSTGRVTALLAGTTTIRATAAGHSGSASVTVTAGPAALLRHWSGGGQAGTVGSVLRDSLVVQATDLGGNPAAGVTVQWVVTIGGGTVSPGSATTGPTGLAATRWTLGSLVGAQTVEARATELTGSPVEFTASAGSGGPTQRTWVGGSSSGPTSWSVIGNWSPAGIPGDKDTAIIPPTANQPVLGGNVSVGALTVQSGARLNTSGYEISVAGSVDATGGVTGDGQLRMSGSGAAVRGTFGNLVLEGSIAAGGGVTAGALRVSGGNFTLNGQTVSVQGDFAASGGTITMTRSGDVLTVGGGARFGNINSTGKLSGGVIRVAGEFATECYNDTEFVSTGTQVVMTGAATIGMCGGRLFSLEIASGARVSTSSNPLAITSALNVSGAFTIAAGAAVDVAGPAGSVVINAGGVVTNNGKLSANLPITNRGSLNGNPAVQR